MGQGVLVSADSRASSGLVFHEGEKKIKPIYFVSSGNEFDFGIAGGAGDAALVKQGFKIIESEFKSWFKSIGSKESRNPLVNELEDMVSSIESKLMIRYRELS